MPQASAQMSKGQWTSVFPSEQVTETQSLVFVKKLLAVSVSSVTYLRGIFPSEAFGDRCIGDLSLKILRDESECKAASQVIKWMKGCFDALEKKYLKTLMVGLYTDPERPDNVVESYTFKFSYDANGPNMDVYRNQDKVSSSAYSAEQTKKATIHLLRNLLLLTNTLDVLPESVLMSMKLTYYDEVTPTEYEPPGFRPADNDTFLFDDETTNIRIGEVSTNFHAIRLRLKTGNREYAQIVGASQTASQQETEMETTNDDLVAVSTGAAKGKKGKPQSAVPGPAGDATSGEDQSQAVLCPCQCNEDDGLMISCEICRKWQHSLCFKIVDEKDVPAKHYCHICAPKVKRACTDPLLEGLDAETAKYACLWRRTLEACRESFPLSVSSLAKRLGCPMTSAHFLINRLEQEGIMSALSGRGKKRGRQLNEEKLNLAHELYMTGSELLSLDNADQTVHTEASQAPDQAGDAYQTIRMDELTEMADGMSVAPDKGKRSKTEKEGRRSLSKRGASTLELSDSQEQDEFQSGKKRRKASNAAH